MCGDYEPAKKALKNLTIIEKMQGSWKEIESPTIGFLYGNMTITNMGGVFSEAHELYTGTKKEDGTVTLSVDDENVNLWFMYGDVGSLNWKIEFIDNNKITLSQLSSIRTFIKTS